MVLLLQSQLFTSNADGGDPQNFGSFTAPAGTEFVVVHVAFRDVEPLSQLDWGNATATIAVQQGSFTTSLFFFRSGNLPAGLSGDLIATGQGSTRARHLVIACYDEDCELITTDKDFGSEADDTFAALSYQVGDLIAYTSRVVDPQYNNGTYTTFPSGLTIRRESDLDNNVACQYADWIADANGSTNFRIVSSVRNNNKAIAAAVFRPIPPGGNPFILIGSASAQATGVSPLNPLTVVALNCGGDQILNGPDGFRYEADQYFSSSGTFDGNNNNHSGIFATSRFNADLIYTIPVSAGQTYDLKLFFAENFHTSSGNRAFDVFVQGIKVLEDLDIWDEVGAGEFTYTQQGVNPNASNQIIIRCTTNTGGGVDNATINGILMVATPPAQGVTIPVATSLGAGVDPAIASQPTALPVPVGSGIGTGVSPTLGTGVSPLVVSPGSAVGTGLSPAIASQAAVIAISDAIAQGLGIDPAVVSGGVGISVPVALAVAAGISPVLASQSPSVAIPIGAAVGAGVAPVFQTPNITVALPPGQGVGIGVSPALVSAEGLLAIPVGAAVAEGVAPLIASQPVAIQPHFATAIAIGLPVSIDASPNLAIPSGSAIAGGAPIGLASGNALMVILSGSAIAIGVPVVIGGSLQFIVTEFVLSDALQTEFILEG